MNLRSCNAIQQRPTLLPRNLSAYTDAILSLLLDEGITNKDQILATLARVLKDSQPLREAFWAHHLVQHIDQTFDTCFSLAGGSTTSESASTTPNSSDEPSSSSSQTVAVSAILCQVLSILFRYPAPPTLDCESMLDQVTRLLECADSPEEPEWANLSDAAAALSHSIQVHIRRFRPQARSSVDCSSSSSSSSTTVPSQPDRASSVTSTASSSSPPTTTSDTLTTRKSISFVHSEAEFSDRQVVLYANINIEDWTSRAGLFFCSYQARTRNFQYLKLYNSESNAQNTYTFLCAVDKQGRYHQMQRPEDIRQNNAESTFRYSTFATFNHEAWDGTCDDYAYFPIVGSSASTGGYFNIYNRGVYEGKVEDAEGKQNVLSLTGGGVDGMSGQRFLGGKSLRGRDKRILYINNSSTQPTNTQAGIIGVDSHGVEGLNKFKPVDLPPGGIKFGLHGLAAGKNHFFFQIGNTNQFVRMDKDGHVTLSPPLEDPVRHEVLTANAVQNGAGNFIELSSGDCMFAVADSTRHCFYFVYLHDDVSLPASTPFWDVYPSDVYWCESESGTWPDVWQYPFIENDNFVYFFPTRGGDISSESTISSLKQPYMKTTHSRYARFDKTHKTFHSPSPTVLPWNVADFQAMSPNTHAMTAGGYIWVFPTGEYNASIATSCCLVIHPDGQTTTLNLGTGTSVNWFFAGSKWKGYTQSYPFHTDSNQSGILWSSADRPYINVAVNSHGLGCLVSQDFKQILLFTGAGHFRVFDYRDRLAGFAPYAVDTSAPIQFHGLFAGTDGFFLSVRQTTEITPRTGDVLKEGYIYISTQGTSVRDEPRFTYHPVISQFADMKNFEDFGTQLTSDDYRKRFKLQHTSWSTAGVGIKTSGFTAVTESPL